MKNLLIKIFRKLIILPLKYKLKNDYKAERYWQDRFKKHGKSLKGVGNEGVSNNENERIYQEAKKQLHSKINELPINIKSCNVLEIGPGIGFYTSFFYKELNLKHLDAIDITDYYFDTLQKELPEYNFIKADISKQKIKGKYDLIFMIDVIEHIVTEEKFKFSLDNINQAINKNGYFIITGYNKTKTRKKLFYVKSWHKKDIINRLHNFSVITEIPFRKTNLMILKKN